MECRQFTEKRQHERVEFNTRILLRAEGLEIDSTGNSRDISMKGMFVSTNEKLSVGSPCQVDIVLFGGIKDIEICMQARVARIEPGGIGIRFGAIDIDSFTHLKYIVAYNQTSRQLKTGASD